MKASLTPDREVSLIRRLVPPVFCGIAGILITIVIAHIPYSFSSLLLSGFLVTFIITHILWLHKVLQPLRHNLKHPEAPSGMPSLAAPLSASPSPLPPVRREEEQAQDIALETSFYQSLQEKLNIVHQSYIRAQSLYNGQTHLLHTNGLIPLLKNSQMDILVQPIVNLPQKRLAFFSCIPCITLENGTLVKLNPSSDSPSNLSFNPAIDKMILFQTLQFVRRHHIMHPNRGFICTLPLSMCKDRHAIEKISEFLHQSHFPFSGLIFEVPLKAVSLDITNSMIAHFSQLKAYGARFIGKWENKELPTNLADLLTPSVDFIMLPYAGLSSWLKRQPRRQSLASLHHILQIAPQTIVSHVDKEQDFYYNLPLPFDFALGEAFGLPKPLCHIQV